jgi:hypothetical protein
MDSIWTQYGLYMDSIWTPYRLYICILEECLENYKWILLEAPPPLNITLGPCMSVFSKLSRLYKKMYVRSNKYDVMGRV